MTPFERAVRFVLNQEGGYSNNPSDRGGETNFGISKRFLDSLPDDEPLKIKPLKEFTIPDAEYLYKKYFWDSSKFTNVVNPQIRIKFFDMAVNLGTKEASLLLQKAYNELYPDTHIKEDGIIGEKSINAINFCNYLALYNTYVDLIIKYYKQLVINHAEQEKFLKGWLKRAANYPE